MIRRASRRSFRAGGDERWLAQFRPTFLSGCVLWLRADLGITLNDAAITFGSAFDNAAWTKNSCSVVADATADPLGTSTADKIVEAAAAAQHDVTQAATSVVNGLPLQATWYAKPNGRSWVFVGTVNEGSFFNVTTGALGTITGSVSSRTITSVGNGWYRIDITFTPTTSTMAMFLGNADNVFSYLGDGASGVFLWGASVTQPKVSAWADQSGLGNNVTQGTAANQPLYVSSAISGKPGATFDGVDDVLARANTSLIGAGGYTMLYAAKFNATPAAFTFILSNFDAGSSGGTDIGNSSGSQRCVNHPSVGTGTDGASTTSVEVVGVNWASGSPATMRVNGASQSLATPPSTIQSFGAAPGVGIGARPGGTNFASATVREVIAYSRPLSAAEQTRVEAYMRAGAGV